MMRKPILVLSVVVGLTAAVLGPLLGLALGAATWVSRARPAGNLLPAATLATASVVLSLGFGLALTWAGWSALRDRPPRPFRLGRWGWWLIAFGVVLSVGQALYTAGVVPLVVAAHIAAGVLPAFLFLALALGSARRRRGGITARPMVGCIAWGGLGGVGPAMLLEMMLVLAGAIGLFLWLAATNPDFITRLEAAALEYQRTGDLQSLAGLAPYVMSLPVILAVMGGLGVLVPMIEEAVKALAVPIVALAGRRLSRLDGFLLGAAAGAGFTVLEGVMNGVLTLSMPAGWAPLMLVRGGTAAIHCCASGLVGLGWESILTERRWARGIGLGAAAVAIHGLWNLCAGAQGLGGLLRGGGAGGAGIGVQAVLMPLALAAMGTIWIGAVLVLAFLPGRLAAGARPLPSDSSLGDQRHEAEDEPVDQEGVQE
jgi:hypothetical protein